MREKLLFIIIYALFTSKLLAFSCSNANSVVISVNNKVRADTFVYFIDFPHEVKVESEALKLFDNCSLLRQNKKPILTGYIQSRYNWMYLKTENPYSYNVSQFIEINYQLDSIVLYELRNNLITKIQVVSEKIPFSYRNIHHRKVLFQVNYTALEKRDFLLFVYMVGSSFKAPISMMSPETFIAEDSTETLIFGIYNGAMLLIFVIAILLWIFFNQRKVYLYYGFYVLFAFVYMADHFGFAFQFLFPALPQIEKHFTYVVIQGIYLFLSLFTNEFFENKRYQRPIKIFILLASLSIFTVILNFIQYEAYYNFQWIFTVFFVLFGCLISIIIPIIHFKKNKLKAILFLAGNILIVAISFITSLNFFINLNLGITLFYLPPLFHLFECIMILVISVLEMIQKEKTSFKVELNLLQSQKEKLELLDQKRAIEVQRQRETMAYQEELIQKQKQINQERTRIASEMHDDLGSGLTTIRYLSDRALKNAKSEEEKSQINKIAEQSNSLVRNMSEIIWAMNSRFDTVENLLSYVRRYASEYLDEFHIHLEWKQDQPFENIKLSGEKRRNVFLVVKEALHNIVKHSEATSVEILVTFTADHIQLVIKDNGKGFDFVLAKEKGNGLFNMEKRMNQIHGLIRWENTSGGVTLLLEFSPEKSNPI